MNLFSSPTTRDQGILITYYRYANDFRNNPLETLHASLISTECSVTNQVFVSWWITDADGDLRSVDKVDTL